MHRPAAALLAIAAASSIAFGAVPARASVVVMVPYLILNTDPGDASGPVLEQDVVFQCDPAWGPEECPIEGIDLRNVEISVLLQMYPWLRDTAWDILENGLPPRPSSPCQPGQAGYCPTSGVFYPTPGLPFTTEMAALSWNFMMVLIAHQTPVDPENLALDEFDPNEPTSREAGQCSYVQPHFCASVIAFLPEPSQALGAAVSLLTLAALARRRS